MTKKDSGVRPGESAADDAVGVAVSRQAGKQAAARAGKIRPSTLRTLVALIMVALVCIGLALHTGTGTPSMFGISSVAALCPLGAIEVAIASRTIVPAGFIGLAFVVVAVLLVGRAFCSWGCPMMLLRKLFGLKSPHERRVLDARKKAGKAKRADGKPDDAPDPERGGVGDSRTWVLGGAIVTTAAFGFPVFCLICPVGLTFATIICLWRAIQFGEATWSLVVFPAILIIETVALRRWCHTLCPLGALIGLISRGNKTLRATLDAGACLESHGKSCGKCVEVCPEGIDLHEGALTTRPSECLKCGECKFACPVQAISFPFLPKKAQATANATGAGAASAIGSGAAGMPNGGADDETVNGAGNETASRAGNETANETDNNNDNECEMTTSKGEAHE